MSPEEIMKMGYDMMRFNGATEEVINDFISDYNKETNEILRENFQITL